MSDLTIPTAEQRNILDFFYQSFRNDLSLFADRRELLQSRLGDRDPLNILDLDGSPMFRDYDVVDNHGKKLGVVRSSSRGAELPLIDSIMIGKLMFEPASARDSALEQAGIDYPGGTFKFQSFVCYGYPRVGLQIEVKKADGETVQVIYDAHRPRRVKEFTGDDIIPNEGEEAGEEAGEAIEGEPFYSISANLPEAGLEPTFLKDWTSAINFVNRTHGLDFKDSSVLANNFSRHFADAASIAEDRFAEPPELPAMSGLTIPIKLIGQDTPVYCAVATGKMILERIGIRGVSQAEIAEAFRTGKRGTTNPKMIRGLKELTQSKWKASFATSPSLKEVMDMLETFAPGKSGIPGHARLIRGWRQYVHLDPETGAPLLNNSFYLINDPYPTGAGQYVLEAVQKPVDNFYRNVIKMQPQ